MLIHWICSDQAENLRDCSHVCKELILPLRQIFQAQYFVIWDEIFHYQIINTHWVQHSSSLRIPTRFNCISQILAHDKSIHFGSVLASVWVRVRFWNASNVEAMTLGLDVSFWRLKEIEINWLPIYLPGQNVYLDSLLELLAHCSANIQTTFRVRLIYLFRRTVIMFFL